MLKKIRSFRKITLVLSLLVALTVVGLGGAALAGSFTVHTTVLSGTVSEAITVNVDGISSDGQWQYLTPNWVWTQPGQPCEAKFLTLEVSNSADVPITVLPAVTAGCPDMAISAGPYSVLAGDTMDITFTWNVNCSSPVGTCTSNITISR